MPYDKCGDFDFDFMNEICCMFQDQVSTIERACLVKDESHLSAYCHHWRGESKEIHESDIDRLRLSSYPSFPLPLDAKGKHDACCDQTTYKAATHVCCDYRLYARQQDRDCCGKRMYNTTEFMCCGTLLYRKPGTVMLACCGPHPYDPRQNICGKGQIGTIGNATRYEGEETWQRLRV